MSRSTAGARAMLRAGISILPLLTAAHALANDAYVNPQTGSDSNSGSPTAPVLTLTKGISIAQSSGGGVVRAMPGIYCDSAAFNNESFPLRIPAGVALQGVGAKECVIRRLQVGVGTGAHSGGVVLPLNPPNLFSHNDVVYPIVDFSLAVHASYDTTFIEGFTFQGGQVQIYTYPEDSQSIRISNCVFDLRNGGDELLPGPEFGILLTATWQIIGGGHYPPLNYHILNNTFVSGYQISASNTNVSIPSCVALANSNDPALWAGSPDPNHTIRGVNDLNVQNNLFRILPGQVAAATIGIDSTDTTANVGVPPVGKSLPEPTNAFDPADVGAFSADPARKWASALEAFKVLPTPVLAIDTSTTPRVDPGFVGEMIGQTQPGLAFPHVRDWRLLETSALRDLGTNPVMTASSATIGATDGLTYTESVAAHDRAFDWDGEGFGNPRIVDSQIDVGYDEVDELIVAGSYGSDSKSHGYPFDPKVTSGNIQRTYFKRATSMVALYNSMRPYVPGKAYDIPPGTTTTGIPPIGSGPWYLASPYTPVAGVSWLFTGWTNPIDGFVHSANVWISSFNDYPPPTVAQVYLNTQAVVTTASGQKTTNLQAEIR